MTGKYRFFSPIEHVEHVESFEIKKRIISNVEVITRSDITIHLRLNLMNLS